MVGVSIMVVKPLNISDIILAIFVLAIVYCNEKDGGCKGGGFYSVFVIQDGSDIPSLRISWDVSMGNCSLGVNRGTRNVFSIVMTIIVNMGDYIIL